MGVSVRGFLKARRDRALGTILGYLEGELRGKVSRDEWDDIRQVVLDAVNSYHDSVLDLMRGEDASTERNEALIDLLQRVDEGLRRSHATHGPVPTGV